MTHIFKGEEEEEDEVEEEEKEEQKRDIRCVYKTMLRVYIILANTNAKWIGCVCVCLYVPYLNYCLSSRSSQSSVVGICMCKLAPVIRRFVIRMLIFHCLFYVLC